MLVRFLLAIAACYLYVCSAESSASALRPRHHHNNVLGVDDTDALIKSIQVEVGKLKSDDTKHSSMQQDMDLEFEGDDKKLGLATSVGAGIGAFAGFNEDDNTPQSIATKAALGGLAGFAASHMMHMVDERAGDDDLGPDSKTTNENCNEGIFPMLSPENIVEFIADTKGDLEKFKNVIANSKIAQFDENNDLVISPRGIFIHGGDLLGGGAGDIRLATMFLRAKIRFPDRIFWLLGDSELSQLRFYSELDPEGEGDVVSKATSICAEIGIVSCVSNRQAELSKLEGLKDVGEVDPKQAVASLRGSVDPTSQGDHPFLLRFLEKGHLILKIGDALMVHGAIRANQMGRVPAGPKLTEVDAWVKELNWFKDDQLNEFSSQPGWVKDDEAHGNVRGGEDLISYGAIGSGRSPRSVVSSDWFAEGGQVRQMDREVGDWLISEGIRRVLTAHTPSGLLPVVIKYSSTASSYGKSLIVIDCSGKNQRQTTFRGKSVQTWNIVTLTSSSTLLNGILPHDLCKTENELEQCSSEFSEKGMYAENDGVAVHHGFELPAFPEDATGAFEKFIGTFSTQDVNSESRLFLTRTIVRSKSLEPHLMLVADTNTDAVYYEPQEKEKLDKLSTSLV